MTRFTSLRNWTPDLPLWPDERIRAAPLRYYVWLPLLRVADMWLRPRTETLPSDTRWWEFNDDPKWSALAVTLGVIGMLYLAMAGVGLVKCRNDSGVGALADFLSAAISFPGYAGES